MRNLQGGIEAWAAAGLPVAGIGAPRVSIFGQVQMIVGLLVLAGTLAGLARFVPGFYAAGFFGFMLAFAGVNGWCGLGMAPQAVAEGAPGMPPPPRRWRGAVPLSRFAGEEMLW
ncbi:hypothetical protein [Sphingomonas sp. 22176]|uniref:hypothetical protein n=1 Tax=Sphingomonas sp. 22176 TaxID=3453884 RepID=UPI003F84EAD5